MDPASFRKALGRRIRLLRASREVSQAALAEAADVAVQFLSRIENGHAMPSIYVAWRVARALGVDLEALVEAGTRPEPPRSVSRLVHHLRARSPAELDRAFRILRELFR